MKLEPGNWFPLIDLLQDAPTSLWDGNLLYRQNNVFGDAAIWVEVSPTGAIQVTLEGISLPDIDNIPEPQTLSNHLLRENLLCLPTASYAFELLLRHDDAEFASSGLVCAALALKAPGTRNQTQIAEVENAFERGLLDHGLKTRADFRIGSRSFRQKFEALLSSEYLPREEWYLEAIFAQWQNRKNQYYTPQPLHESLISNMEIRLEPAHRQLGFRIADLFKSTS